MAILKCKMCGGTLEINNKETVATCEYCGTKQTLPRFGNDRKENLYERANHFRRSNDFDKAMGIYEQILNEDNTDAESYWSLVLCRYGIEYVEDPKSHKRIPTVNRAQYTSVYADEDYKSAIRYADASQKEVYEYEANLIDEIQKSILEISQKEEPFDVFLCYKETDVNGRRTPDSVIATELYHELTREGFKVFFSRITLEDKLGREYEPYIFAALNSAKVMVVLGTNPEYFNAVWVKNEWSRYLALIKNGAKKMLVPAYKDMDPYDLPEEFSHLQAQDMSKLGFMHDLVHGIRKIIEANSEKQVAEKTVIATEPSSGNINALLKRGFMSIEEGDWAKADYFFEQTLNQNAELAEAYLGKLMVEMNVHSRSDLIYRGDFTSSINYQRVMAFGDQTIKDELNTYLEKAKSNDRYEPIYESAIKVAERFKDDIFQLEFRIHSIKGAISKLESISFYKDAQAKANEYRQYVSELETKKQKQGCYVATAVYGSYDCPQVWTLRRFRDYTLAETWYGRAFIRTYYAISPTLVKWFGNTGWFRKIWKGKLDRMVARLQEKGIESTPYEDKNW